MSAPPGYAPYARAPEEDGSPEYFLVSQRTNLVVAPLVRSMVLLETLHEQCSEWGRKAVCVRSMSVVAGSQFARTT